MEEKQIQQIEKNNENEFVLPASCYENFILDKIHVVAYMETIDDFAKKYKYTGINDSSTIYDAVKKYLNSMEKFHNDGIGERVMNQVKANNRKEQKILDGLDYEMEHYYVMNIMRRLQDIEEIEVANMFGPVGELEDEFVKEEVEEEEADKEFEQERVEACNVEFYRLESRILFYPRMKFTLNQQISISQMPKIIVMFISDRQKETLSAFITIGLKSEDNIRWVRMNTNLTDWTAILIHFSHVVSKNGFYKNMKAQIHICSVFNNLSVILAVGVSGGPNSMALCLLAENWKTYCLNATSKGKDDVVDGLLAIIVDHGLRAESKDEVDMVQRRVLNLDGKPKRGHLQEAARDMSQHRIGVLLIAHHVDDQICKGSKQEWVEDPTNQKTIFARNRIQMSLGNLSSSIFKFELQAIISACRRTRFFVTLINQSLTVMPASFPAAGCYLCPSPRSKGTKILVICSVNSGLPMKMNHSLSVFHVPFLNTSCDSILTEAKRVNIISEPTFTNICSLHKPEHENFKLKTEIIPDHESRKLVESVGAKELLHEKIGNFKDRFLVPWEFID
uniref:tRNA(Ile)-lysidine synthetase n=1 Tax=Tanacetum cinerariifolium TaxID=118510 RepID=A0A6L2KH96_TANCI|nr:hypothetical protein [Tanacetum cinerariifolium]